MAPNNNNNVETVDEDTAYEYMVEIFDAVLDHTSGIEAVEELHRQTRDYIADGNDTFKDRFFEYAYHKSGEIMREGLSDRDPDVMQEAINMLRDIDQMKQNWRD